MIEQVRRFALFWYGFVVGDDWRVAVAVVLALALTCGLGRAGIASWWVVPATVLVVLPWSLWRARRKV